jgi:hypothetical protein
MLTSGEGYMDLYKGIGESLVLSLWVSLTRCVCSSSVVHNVTLDFTCQLHDGGSL